MAEYKVNTFDELQDLIGKAGDAVVVIGQNQRYAATRSQIIVSPKKIKFPSTKKWGRVRYG